MGLVKTRRLAAMQKQQRAKAGMKPLMKGNARKGLPRQPAPAPKMIKQVRPVLSFWKSRGGFDAVERRRWHLVYYAAEGKVWDW